MEIISLQLKSTNALLENMYLRKYIWLENTVKYKQLYSTYLDSIS